MPEVWIALLIFLPVLSEPQLVSFPTRDEGVVYADIYGEGNRGVVLAHGGRFTKESWAKQAEQLAEAGFRVAAIDFRGRGRSRGGPGAASPDDGVQYDVLAAVRYLRRNGAETVSVVGASFGGWAAGKACVEARLERSIASCCWQQRSTSRSS